MLEKLFKTYRVEELAYRLGVSAATVYKWKAGAVEPSPLALEKITKFYNKTFKGEKK